MPNIKKSALIIVLSVFPFWVSAETKLLMMEEIGCYWCARWNEEIAHIYPKTAEGRTAPLERYDLQSESPDAELTGKVRFTPTFILVNNGQEVGRIEGYPGHDFFWGLLNMLFQDASIPLDEAS